jgi:hypothetical protein
MLLFGIIASAKDELENYRGIVLRNKFSDSLGAGKGNRLAVSKNLCP